MQDLSSLVGDPFAGQSMAGGNTTTEKTPNLGGAQGTPSESTDKIPSVTTVTTPFTPEVTARPAPKNRAPETDPWSLVKGCDH